MINKVRCTLTHLSQKICAFRYIVIVSQQMKRKVISIFLSLDRKKERPHIVFDVVIFNVEVHWFIPRQI